MTKQKKSTTKAKKIDENVFKAESTTDVFGEKVSDHPLLADGAEVQSLETYSDTKLEDDIGVGQNIILRIFEFSANPEAFKNGTPSAQVLFNSHIKGIEGMLWADGLVPYYEVEPRIILSKDRTKYRFYIPSTPRQGVVLTEKSQTLSEIANASRTNQN